MAVSSLFILGYAAILLTNRKHKESGSLIYIESKTSDNNNKQFQAPRNAPLRLHDARQAKYLEWETRVIKYDMERLLEIIYPNLSLFIYEKTKTGEIKHTILLIFFICFRFIFLWYIGNIDILEYNMAMPRAATRWHLLFLQKTLLTQEWWCLAFPRTTRAWMEFLSVQLPLSFPSHFIPELQNQEGWERGLCINGKWVRGKWA